MPKLNEVPLLPQRVESQEVRDLQQALVPLLRAVGLKVNALASGRLSAKDETATAAPTVGTWQQGDEITNSAPTELGTASSKYVVRGWMCVASGTPGTWVQQRYMTGN